MANDVALPVRILKKPGGYKIVDASDRTLCWIYCRELASVARAAHVLTFTEGEAIAKRIARALSLPPESR